MKLAVTTLAATWAFASAALACTPAPNSHTYSEVIGSCGKSHYAQPTGSEGISDASDMKNGVVSQIFHDGTACGYAFSRIIVDCTIGEAVVFGPSSYGGAMTDVEVAVRDLQPYEQLSQRIDQLADAEQPIKVQEIFETANRNNMPNAKIVSIVGTQIGISNSDARPQHNYDFSCGCKLYYPNSQGAKS